MVSSRPSRISRMAGVNRSVWLRSFLLESLWNYPRMQNIGFTYCIYPAIKCLHSSESKFREALKRQLESANTHPSMSPLFAGLTARLERDLSTGNLGSYRRRIMATLAAHGDRIFWGNLKPLAAVVGVLVMLVFPDSFTGPFLALLIYNAPNLYIRVKGFKWGFEEGLAAINRFKSARNEKWIASMRVLMSLSLGAITGILLWQCYQNQFKIFGKFYSVVSLIDLGLAGLVGYLSIRSGLSVSKVTFPVALAAVIIFGLARIWIGNQ